jgi:nucleoid-associated protein YgaU
MFLDSSRYARVKQVLTTTRDGKEVKVVKLRRLSEPEGLTTQVKGHDRLDVMAHRNYGDGTRFWRIADANTELKANDLMTEAGREIEVPES